MERIISSNAETAVIKGMHHVMNAEYSRKLSIRIGDGLREKFDAGYMNGLPPFGWQRLPMGVASDRSSQKQLPS